MSGKTQLLKSYAKYVKKILLGLYDSYIAGQGLPTFDHWKSGEKVQTREAYNNWMKSKNHLTYDAWAAQYGFGTGGLENKSTDIATSALEEFSLSFPYKDNNTLYNVKINGFDLAGQNIYDHIRRIIAGLSQRGDIIFAIFDSSRLTSCRNSIYQLTESLGNRLQAKKTTESFLPSIVPVANKIDLLTHLKSAIWQETFIKAIIRIFDSLSSKTSFTYNVPYLRPEQGKKQERKIDGTVTDGKINFVDFEAIIYSIIRSFDSEYPNGLMTDVNAKSIGREIATLLVNQRIERELKTTVSSEERQTAFSDHFEEFGKLIYSQRPLAVQYPRAFEIIADTITDPVLKLREKWSPYFINIDDISEKAIQRAINESTSTQGVLNSLGNSLVETNALSETSAAQLFEDIINRKIRVKEQPSEKKKRIKRF
ncbi:MAG: Rab family GTPase [Promethearchaeota archaeon]